MSPAAPRAGRVKITQHLWTNSAGWSPALPSPAGSEVQLVLLFGAVDVLRRADLLGSVNRSFPRAEIFGCSTAGEICGGQVLDDTLTATPVHFESTSLRSARVELHDMTDSFHTGAELAKALPAEVPSPAEATGTARLAHVLVLSDGVHVNGSDLVRGLVQNFPPDITVTGGLAGDGARFSETLVVGGGGLAGRTVAVLGLYGSRLKAGYGSFGGWDPFGPERLITRSEGNVLYELDGRSALELYEKYLGDHARELPAAGLLFPLSLRSKAGATPVVRTILGIDRAAPSMTFAGDMPEGAYARLMKANFDRLIDGAAQAGRIAAGPAPAQLALLISCVGRKLVLKQRVEEEVEGVRDALGPGAVFTGFYSYGEISPFTPGAKCELHNQTMTVTTLSET